MISAAVHALAPYVVIVILSALAGVSVLYSVMRSASRRDYHAKAARMTRVPEDYWRDFTSSHGEGP